MAEDESGHSHGHASDNESEHVHDHAGHGHEQLEQGHQHPHSHDHDDEHSHEHGFSFGTLLSVFGFHAHSHGPGAGMALESSEKGIRAVKISLLVLAATAAFQVAVVLASGSVALLADTIHNFTDALTAIPLWLAFVLGRRAASRRFTYGQGRAEDLAGVMVVLIIAASALVAGYESVRKILHPEALSHIEWVVVAAIVGFLGNEAVAIFRIGVGREINSASLIADGLHARIDGLTSLAVLIGALGVLAGWPAADPIIGALITLAILFIVKDAAVLVGRRLMDGIEPELVTEIENVAADVIAAEPKARGINNLRVRWLGHKLHIELNLVVNDHATLQEGHRLSQEMEHALRHAFSAVESVMIHVDPDGHHGDDPHMITAHHLGTPSTHTH